MKIKKQIISKQMREAAVFLGEIPTRKWWRLNSKSHGYASAVTIQRAFGSWNNALHEIFGEQNITSPRDRVNVKCDTCGQEFAKKPSQMRSNKNYCTHDCYSKRPQY